MQKQGSEQTNVDTQVYVIQISLSWACLLRLLKTGE